MDADAMYRSRARFGEPSITGPKLKALRAGELFNAMQIELEQFRLSGALTVPRPPVVETDDQGNKWDVVYCDKVERVPMRFSLLAGDVVHNLRSALDHLAYQLVLVDKGKPNKTTAFPLFTRKPSGRALERYKAALRGIKNEQVLKLIHSHQPFKPPKTDKRENLALLGELDNIDKHRLIRPGLLVLKKVAASPNAIVNQGQIEEGKEMFRQPASGATDFSFGFNHDFVFWEQQVTRNQLGVLIGTVEEIINLFAPFFFSDP